VVGYNLEDGDLIRLAAEAGFLFPQFFGARPFAYPVSIERFFLQGNAVEA
jgi:hypothetical protein